MNTSQRSGLAGGLILIVLGLIFLSFQWLPGMWDWATEATWPLIIVGIGIVLLVIGLIARAPGLAVPACIVGGIGLLLYWQNATGNWESWAYAWTLIPGFVGVGTMLMGVIEGKGETIRAGIWLIIISLILFAIFASFLGGPVSLGKYWPVLLILLGVILLVRYLTGGRRTVEVDS
jgi:hypothetical protein